MPNRKCGIRITIRTIACAYTHGSFSLSARELRMQLHLCRLRAESMLFTYTARRVLL